MFGRDIKLQVSPTQTVSDIFDNMAHEYWHAHQRDEIFWLNHSNKYLRLLQPSRTLRAGKYRFNRRHYIEDDIIDAKTRTIKQAYEDQFVEVEANAFAKMLSGRFNTLLSRADIDPSSIDTLSLPTRD